MLAGKLFMFQGPLLVGGFPENFQGIPGDIRGESWKFLGFSADFHSASLNFLRNPGDLLGILRGILGISRNF